MKSYSPAAQSAPGANGLNPNLAAIFATPARAKKTPAPAQDAYPAIERELIYPALRYIPPRYTLDTPDDPLRDKNSPFSMFHPCYPGHLCGRFAPLVSNKVKAADPAGFHKMRGYVITGHAVNDEDGYDVVFLEVAGKTHRPDGVPYHMIWSVRDDVAAEMSEAQIETELFQPWHGAKLRWLRDGCHRVIHMEKIFLRESGGTLTSIVLHETRNTDWLCADPMMG